MSLAAKLQPYVAHWLTSRRLRDFRRGFHRWRRRLLRRPATLVYFHRVDDPYAYLTAQVLAGLARRFHVRLVPRAVADVPAAMYPEPELYADYARRDAGRLAGLYELDFPGEPVAPDADTARRAARALAEIRKPSAFLATACRIGRCLWRGDGEGALAEAGAPALSPAQAERRLQAAARALRRRGHYLTATIHFEGEWYWGLDRLDHLEARLIAEGLARTPGERVHFDRQYRWQRTAASSPSSGPQGHSPTLVCYFSARSPYSYIGLELAAEVAGRHGAELDVRPVLPMVMRGMRVPRAKRLYILRDAKREADKFGIPFGFICDPLGAGVERIYAVFDFAVTQGRGIDFLRSAGRGVWAEALDPAGDDDLSVMVERAGLEWEQARNAVHAASWRHWAERHERELRGLGLWGVPSFRCGSVAVWGQDRLWVMERVLAGDNDSTPQC